MAAAMHDPIIPGKRTAHFATLGQDEVTTVRIASVPVDGGRSTADDPDQLPGETTHEHAGVYIESGRESAAADSSER